jgi:hypothetical protein
VRRGFGRAFYTTVDNDAAVTDTIRGRGRGARRAGFTVKYGAVAHRGRRGALDRHHMRKSSRGTYTINKPAGGQNAC